MSWFSKLSFSEHRKSPRMKAPLLVAYYWDGAAPMARQIKNISSTGFYLVTKERWHPGTIITMTLQRTSATQETPAAAEHYVSVMSMVVRLEEEGVAFAFIPLTVEVKEQKSLPVGKKTLRRFLEQLKSDQGHAVIGHIDAILKTKLPRQDLSSAIPGENVMKRLTDDSGQALIMSALCMTCLFGFMALAADVGIMLREKRLVQIAADSAAIAGALENNYSSGAVSSAAQAAATQNGFTNGTGGATVVVHPVPLFGPHVGAAGYVEVIVSQTQPTLFMGFLGFSSLKPTARAVASSLGTTNGCIYTLGTSGADISITGNSTISIATCGIIDNSSSNNALSMNGNVTLDAQSIGVVGGVSKTGNISLTPTPVTGIVPTSDPLNFLPTPAIPSGCSANPNLGSGTTSLTAGCYNGISANGNVTLNLSPGLFVINGNLNLNGNVNLNGTGVTLVLEGTTNLPGNVSLNLSAPTSGTYNGVLIFQPLANTNDLALTGNSGSVLKGIVYAPGAKVTLTGNSGSSIYADFVAKSLALVGNASLNDYASINGNSVLSSVRLVE